MQIEEMMPHNNLPAPLVRSKIRNGDIQFGGNKSLKIYGLLGCRSGKRMKQTNRVFFCSESEAIEAGYRPCSNCMPKKYLAWKQRSINPDATVII
jgi:methylphosphotriester-DNA--protein-cysteine methyltransferase